MEERDRERLDSAVEKLIDISSDLKRIIAVHEQRIIVLEKDSDKSNDYFKERRIAVDESIDKVYETIHREDKEVLLKTNSLTDTIAQQSLDITKRIDGVEKTIWIYIGGLGVIVLLFTGDGSNAHHIITTIVGSLFKF
jgi:SMC interacting uncharacterized protein involved in chromosome segregation